MNHLILGGLGRNRKAASGGGGTMTLKTSGVATLASCVLAVNGSGVIQEFVSPTVNSQKTVESGVTTGSSSWKGTSRDYFETLADGSFDMTGILFGTTKPAVNFGTGVGFFVACAGMGTPTSFNRHVVGINAANDGWGRHGSTNKQAFYISSGDRHSSTTDLPSDGTTKFSMGANFTNGGSVAFYYGLESGSLAADGTATDSGFGSDVTADAVGGSPSNGAQPGKYHVVCVFADPLTLTEYQSLHDDWFSTLFDVS